MVTVSSQYAHGTLTVRSRYDHGKLTVRSRYAHSNGAYTVYLNEPVRDLPCPNRDRQYGRWRIWQGMGGNVNVPVVPVEGYIVV